MNAVWMLLACFLFATMGACAKQVAFQFNAGQSVLIRGLIPVLLIGTWMLWQRASLRTPHWKSHLYRSLAGGSAMLMYFGAITLLPLASAVTLNNTSALFMTAVISMRQRPPRHVLGGLALGLAGVVLLLQPAFSREQWLGGLLGLGSAMLACIAQLNLSQLGRAGEPEWRTVFILSVTMSLLAAPLAAVLPSNVSEAQGLHWALLAGVGLCGGFGQLALTKAFSCGRALVTASLAYMTVVFSSLYGVIFWHEHLSASSWLGIAAIITAGLITTGRLRPRRAPGRD